jgi:hypothetical protein
VSEGDLSTDHTPSGGLIPRLSSPDFGGLPVAARVARVVEEGVAALAEAGAVVETVDLRLPRDQFELGELWYRLIAPLYVDTLDGLAAAGIDLLGEHRAKLRSPTSDQRRSAAGDGRARSDDGQFA